MARKRGYLDVEERIRDRSVNCRLAAAAGGTLSIAIEMVVPRQKLQRLTLRGALTIPNIGNFV